MGTCEEKVSIIKTHNLQVRLHILTMFSAHTDVALGKNCGLRTLLVGSGVHSLEDVRQWEREGRNELVPDFYIDSLGGLCERLKSSQNKV